MDADLLDPSGSFQKPHPYLLFLWTRRLLLTSEDPDLNHSVYIRIGVYRVCARWV